MSDVNRVDVEAIRARADAATPGPWSHYPEAGWIEVAAGKDESSSTEIIINGVRPAGGWGAGIYEKVEADAEFIAHARTDIPALLAENQELRGRLEEAERKIATALGVQHDERGEVNYEEDNYAAGWAHDVHEFRKILFSTGTHLAAAGSVQAEPEWEYAVRWVETEGQPVTDVGADESDIRELVASQDGYAEAVRRKAGPWEVVS